MFLCAFLKKPVFFGDPPKSREGWNSTFHPSKKMLFFAKKSVLKKTGFFTFGHVFCQNRRFCLLKCSKNWSKIKKVSEKNRKNGSIFSQKSKKRTEETAKKAVFQFLKKKSFFGAKNGHFVHFLPLFWPLFWQRKKT